MKTKLFFKYFPYLVIAILLYIINIGKSNIDNNNIETKIDSTYTPIKIDSIITKFDTIKNIEPKVKDSIVYKINPYNEELLKKYEEATNKLELYKKAIKEHEYEEVFEDSIQKITVYSKTRGKLLKQSVNTTLKERNIPNYTKTITNTIIKQDNSKIFIGIDANIPTKVGQTFVLTPSIMYKSPNHNIFKVGFDNEGIKGGFYINLW